MIENPGRGDRRLPPVVVENGLYRAIKHRVGKAIRVFDLIQDGDRILVALSGGKDSWTLLHILEMLRRRAPVRYELVAATIDSGFPGFEAERIEAYCREKDFAFHREETRAREIIEEKRDVRKSYCAFCARLRRGALYNLAERLGCTKIALGHHLDDAVETLLLNQFYVGTLGAMPPKLVSDDGRNTVIRPLIYVEEKQAASFARRNGFPLVSCRCPQCDFLGGKRARVKALLRDLEREDRRIKRSLLRSLHNVQPRHLMDVRFGGGGGAVTGDVQAGTGPITGKSMSDSDFFFFSEVDERELAREKAKARELRRSQWWKRRRSSGVCHYCKRRFPPRDLTMDHLVPLARGGKSVRSNVVPCCKECNSKKRYLLPVEWEEYMAGFADEE